MEVTILEILLLEKVIIHKLQHQETEVQEVIINLENTLLSMKILLTLQPEAEA
jgi:hypothetical protein